MYLQHFGLRHPALGKDIAEPWDDGALAQLTQRFNWLLQSPGIGLLTGEPGVGKTAARGLARALGLEPSYRRAQLWRDIKLRVHELVDTKQVTPLWIIDEALQPAGRVLPRLPRVPELRATTTARPHHRLAGRAPRAGANARARAVCGALQPPAQRACSSNPWSSVNASPR